MKKDRKPWKCLNCGGVIYQEEFNLLSMGNKPPGPKYNWKEGRYHWDGRVVKVIECLACGYIHLFRPKPSEEKRHLRKLIKRGILEETWFR